MFILTLRPSKSAHAYKKIWLKEKNESPLLYFTRIQAQKLKAKIGKDDVIVDFAMRYGNPSIKSKLNLLKNLGCENIVFFLCILSMLQLQLQPFVMKFTDF